MSQGKLRKENNCLNCNAVVSGRYCSVCGQQNIEPKETFGQLISHFIYDLFHYDGKVLFSLKTLLFKPGLLTHEYVRGRRACYLHPIRLYIFISAVFFIIFISFIAGNKSITEDIQQLSSAQTSAIQKTINQLKDSLNITSDTIKQNHIQSEIKALEKVPDFFPSLNDTGSNFIGYRDTSNKTTGGNVLMFGDLKLPPTLKEYNSAQAKLTADKRDRWLTRSVNTKIISINEKYKYDLKGFLDSLKENFLHLLPTMMFISLPAVAIIFWLLYIRRRKQFTYVQHGVFSVHIYSAVFVFILILYALGVLNNYLQWNLVRVVISIGDFFIFFYVYKSMRNFYEQRRWKTIFKYFIFLFSYFIVLSLLLIIFLLTSLITV